MKTNFFAGIVSGTAVAILCLAGGGSFPIANAQEQSAPTTGDAALPSDVSPDSPLAQVVRLTQAGVDENVILAYISNSNIAFNLTSDQIIYLKDLGLPNDAVTAMIQRDQQLGATANTAPAPTEETTAPAETPAQPAEVTQNYFYDTLSPYGGWVDVDGYGLCWQPTVVDYDSSWQPYCDHGHWVYTDDGWYWLSDYSWGATAFHYGRWFHDPHHGWCWWPDTVWGPSWVTWRYADDYCGWAPLPPHTVYREGVGIFYNGAAVGAGFNFGLSANFFTFVPTKNFNDLHPRRYRVAPAQVTKFYSHTTVINNFNADSRSHAIINAGIPPQRITAVTRMEIHPVTIRETSAPVTRGEQLQKDTLVVNRPHFDAKAAATLNSGVRPHPVIINENRNNSNSRPSAPVQNNFQRPSMNQTPADHNPQMGAPIQTPPVTQHQVPQNRNDAPNMPRPTNQNPQPNRNQFPSQTPPANQTRIPQNHNATTQPVAPAARNPQAESPVQTTVPNRNEPYMSPRMQEQSPHVAVPKPEERVVAPVPQQPQINSAPHIEERPNNEPPANRVEPPATQDVQPRSSQPVSPATSGQQKSGKDKDQNGPGN